MAHQLRDRIAATDTLFIFARAVNGPRMPLAAERSTAATFPRDFRLDDSMAMAPGATISTAGDVVGPSSGSTSTTTQSRRM